MEIKNVLLIESHQGSRELLNKLLANQCSHLTSLDNPSSATSYLKTSSYDLIIVDEKAKKALEKTCIIEAKVVMTSAKAYTHLPDGIQGILTKPFSQKTKAQLQQLLSSKHPPIIGTSPVFTGIVKKAKKLAMSNANIFITGESGTGKEVIASLIHAYSHRANHPFIKVNCAAISETLMESEFFGHERGAFTGATEQRLGRFELAHQGTLLLDEISEIPTFLQAKLLRVIQEREFERVGSSQPIQTNVRLISTSNQQLQKSISEGNFRNDLYYRLNVASLHLPPLKERKEDIPLLAAHFLTRSAKAHAHPPKVLSKKSLSLLLSYDWPGNVRELANVLEQASILCPAREINPTYLQIQSPASTPLVSLKEVEREYILRVFNKCNQHQGKAAAILGISPKTLRSRLKLQ